MFVLCKYISSVLVMKSLHNINGIMLVNALTHLLRLDYLYPL